MCTLLVLPALFEGTERAGAACPASGRAAAAEQGRVGQQGLWHTVLLDFLLLHLSGQVKKVHSLMGDKSTPHIERNMPNAKFPALPHRA